MENQVQVFTSEQFGEVRTTEINGVPHFVAADVCRALELEPTATRRLDEDEISILRLTQGTSNGGNPNVNVVTESGLYSLVLGSRKPEAKTFKRWITHDVIPSIRKHGAYMTPAKLEEVMNDPDAWIKMLTAIKDERDRTAKLKAVTTKLYAKLANDAPKVELAEAISEPDGSVLIRDFEKLLRAKGYQIKTNGLYKWMESENLIEVYNGRIKRAGYGYSASAKGIKSGITANHLDKQNRVTAAIITPKGQEYIIEHVGEIANQQTKIVTRDKPTDTAMTLRELQSRLTREGFRLVSYKGNWLYEFMNAKKLIKVYRDKGYASVYMASPVSLKAGWLVNKLNAQGYISSAIVTPSGADYISNLVKAEV